MIAKKYPKGISRRPRFGKARSRSRSSKSRFGKVRQRKAILLPSISIFMVATGFLYAMHWANAYLFTVTLSWGTWATIISMLACYGLLAWLAVKASMLIRRSLKGLWQALSKNTPDGRGLSPALRNSVRGIIFSLFLWSIAHWNLLMPWFSALADVWVVTSPIVFTASPEVEKSYQEMVRQGEFWSPWWLKSDKLAEVKTATAEEKVFKRIAQYHGYLAESAKEHHIPLTWVAGAMCVESSGGFSRLRKENGNGQSGSELGAFQLQHKLCQDYGLRTMGRWNAYMGGTKTPERNAYLEHQRSKFLVFWCGFDLAWPLDVMRYYVVSSIDDRLSSKAFDFAGKMLAIFSKRVAKTGKDPLANGEAVFTHWNPGSDTAKYISQGEEYVAWARKYGLK